VPTRPVVTIGAPGYVGLCDIPKSVKAYRIAENINVFDFALTPKEVAAIDVLDTACVAAMNSDAVRLDSCS
jgi:diketogulonate reductase-like aldo/keto reductase